MCTVRLCSFLYWCALYGCVVFCTGVWWAKKKPGQCGADRAVLLTPLEGGVSLAHELPYFYEAAGVCAVLVLVCLAPLVDVVDVLGLVGFFAVVAFGFVLWCPHGVT